MTTLKTPIELDHTEQKVRNLLLDYANEYHKTQGNELVLRITGGWVRDKLLNKQSHDLDVGIQKLGDESVLTGQQFVMGLLEYCEQTGMEKTKFHTIAANPEKSKHLETATTRLFDLDIDFVHLRSEEYTKTSRVPVPAKGSPEEDANRRDATLNALFYNLSTQQVEDYTGHGLEDLQNGVLRTPLASFKTFDDDPLRVLRLLRFASTFGFSIANDALAAMSNEEIHESLMSKISRERVGVELEKMLESANPQVGLQLIVDLGLENCVFQFVEQFRPKTLPVPESTMQQAVQGLTEFRNGQQIPELQTVFADPKQARVLWAMTSLSRWGLTGTTNKKVPLAVCAIVLEGIKWSNEYSQLAKMLVSVEERVANAANSQTSRKDLGQLVRDCGEHWRMALVYSIMVRHVTNELVIDRYDALQRQIIQVGLDEAWKLMPLANGGDIQKLFESKGGPWLKQAIDQCIEYQLEFPDATKQQCLEYLAGIGKPEFDARAKTALRHQQV